MDSQTRRYLEKRGVKLDSPAFGAEGSGPKTEVRIGGWGERFTFSDHCDESFSLKAALAGLRDENSSFGAFMDWFDRHITRVDGNEYRRAYWRMAYKYCQTLGNRPRSIETWLFDDRDVPYGRAYIWHINLGAYLMACGVSMALWYIVKFLGRHLHRLRRPTYYQAERDRRLNLASERRKIRHRRTINPCPTPDALRKAFATALDSSENMIRFGSMLEDLECYVDNSLILDRDTLRIKGRHGGIRRYLEGNVPELAARYKTVMRYKALARKFRQATGVDDPIPASAVLDELNAERDELPLKNVNENSPKHILINGSTKGPERDMEGDEGHEGGGSSGRESSLENSPKRILMDGKTKGRERIAEKSIEVARKIISGEAGSFLGLVARLEMFVGAECVNSATVWPDFMGKEANGRHVVAG